LGTDKLLAVTTGVELGVAVGVVSGDVSGGVVEAFGAVVVIGINVGVDVGVVVVFGVDEDDEIIGGDEANEPDDVVIIGVTAETVAVDDVEVVIVVAIALPSFPMFAITAISLSVAMPLSFGRGKSSILGNTII
jgi:hypothetical protein